MEIKKLTIKYFVEYPYNGVSTRHLAYKTKLDSMNEHDISNDEKFVNTFSELLYQYFKTAKYE